MKYYSASLSLPIMALCEKCALTAKEAQHSFYKGAIDVIEKKIKNIPSDVLDIIIDYAFVKQVVVVWNARLNIACSCVSCHYDRYQNQPLLLLANAVPTYDCRRIRELSMNLCPKCFAEGIERHPGRLPHSDTDCFLSTSEVLVDPYKYVLPQYYKLFYYRSSKPAVIDGKLYISWV